MLDDVGQVLDTLPVHVFSQNGGNLHRMAAGTHQHVAGFSAKSLFQKVKIDFLHSTVLGLSGSSLHSHKNANVEVDGNGQKRLDVSGVAIRLGVDGAQKDTKGLQIYKNKKKYIFKKSNY